MEEVNVDIRILSELDTKDFSKKTAGTDPTFQKTQPHSASGSGMKTGLYRG
jgi:hypothetical protein